MAGYLVAVNVVVGAFNLIPGFPLDGGRMLRAAVWWRQQAFARATTIATRVGAGCAIGLIAFGALRGISGDLLGGFWLALIGLFLRRASAASQDLARIRGRLKAVPVATLMAAPVSPTPHDVHVGDTAWEAFTSLSRPGVDCVAVRDACGTVVGSVSRTAIRTALAAPSAAAPRRAA